MTKYGHAWTKDTARKIKLLGYALFFPIWFFFLYNHYYDDGKKNSPANILHENHHIKISFLPLSPASYHVGIIGENNRYH